MTYPKAIWQHGMNNLKNVVPFDPLSLNLSLSEANNLKYQPNFVYRNNKGSLR